MRLIVSSIVGGVYEQNSIVKKICADDWTAERAIIASNVLLIISAPAGGVSLHETCCHGYTMFCISAPAGGVSLHETRKLLWRTGSQSTSQSTMNRTLFKIKTTQFRIVFHYDTVLQYKR